MELPCKSDVHIPQLFTNPLQFHNLINPIITSIFAGNGIIVKGSEATAWSSQYYIAIAQKALEVCGHDPNLVQSITCWPDVAGHLTSHPDIAHLTFIGSRPVALKVAESAGKSLTPLCAELGGKDPSIVLDDIVTSKTEVDRDTSIIMRGIFQSAGQNCIGIERIIACPKAYETLKAQLEPKIKALRVGYSLSGNDDEKVDVGACISSANFSKLESLIADAVSRGARVLVGGKQFVHPKYPKGHYFLPTLLVDVSPSMPIAHEELFAPVALLMRADSPKDAVKIANSVPYALGSSVFALNASSPDVQYIVNNVHAGMVAVNDFGAFYVCNLPFGGVKGSGYGRFGGLEGLRSVSNPKAICVDRWPGVRTGIPGAMALPVPDADRAWKSMSKILIVAYGSWGMLLRVVGLRKKAFNL